MGLEQTEKGEPSRLHSNPATPTSSVPVNVNLMVGEWVAPPPDIGSPLWSTAEVMDVSGGIVSMHGMLLIGLPESIPF